MATTLNDLLNDVILQTAERKEAERRMTEVSTRLIDALALLGKPLSVGGEVVIGSAIIRRPYTTMPVVVSDISVVDACEVTSA